MKNVGIAFSTKDRVELSKRSIEPLLGNHYHVHWVDGSTTEEGQNLPTAYPVERVTREVRGGADAAIVYSLSVLLYGDYDYVGLVENDVLLHPDWFGPTMALFERGQKDGLEVGAVSARCYEDRILVQREGYALMHNLGAGMVVFSRRAAEIVLRHFRTGHASENRAVFSALSSLDPARWCSFLAAAQQTTADWQFDTILARHGLASLALVPSPCEMIGQVPPLEEQGLRIASQPQSLLENDKAFARFRDATAAIRAGELAFSPSTPMVPPEGGQVVFAHQLGLLAGKFDERWKLRWSQGYGPFAWEAREGGALLSFFLHGGGAVVASGGKVILACDDGYQLAPTLAPDKAMVLAIPPKFAMREVRVRAVEPGVVVHAVHTTIPQPLCTVEPFTWRDLPPVE